jgi:alpha-L-fucosidase
MMVEDKILNFEKMGLGLFIHWGLYAHFAEGEWAQNILEVPNYSQAFTHFNPDPKKIRQWVTLAKQNGFKYIVLTA